ncbi:MAG: hypothetical protein HY547_06665, partial [Elusimicrobia bacterium]|nr:hypothetical protein [Elusimicrobiota bacterium]
MSRAGRRHAPQGEKKLPMAAVIAFTQHGALDAASRLAAGFFNGALAQSGFVELTDDSPNFQDCAASASSCLAQVNKNHGAHKFIFGISVTSLEGGYAIEAAVFERKTRQVISQKSALIKNINEIKLTAEELAI